MPASGLDRPDLDDAAILARRGPRNQVDALRPYAFLVEEERTANGGVEDVATIFITNRECPFRCVMCDLWRNTTLNRVPAGAVTRQIEWALGQLPAARHVKLYNSGNFFDPQAIPRADWPDIADLLRSFRTVIVESHPRLIDRRCLEWQDLLEPRLEIAMGLETVDPDVLPRLNKRMTLEDFGRACDFLSRNDIDARAFILLRTPFQTEREGVLWARRSLDFAFSQGVGCCVVIPTRAGNGAMDWLLSRGDFAPPSLRSLEEVVEYGVGLDRGRVFADLWDLDKFYACRTCGPGRRERLEQMNRTQRVYPRIRCGCDIEPDRDISENGTNDRHR